MKSKIGSRLRAARERKGWTQSFAAKKLGIPNSTLSGYEQGRRDPDPEKIREFAELYEVSADFLVGNDKEIPEIQQGINVKEVLKKGHPTFGGRVMSEEECRLAIAFLETIIEGKKEKDSTNN